MLSQTQCPRDIGQILAPEMAEAEVTGSPRDAPEGKWIPNGGIEIPSTYKVCGRIDKKAICGKKLKGLNNF